MAENQQQSSKNEILKKNIGDFGKYIILIFFVYIIKYNIHTKYQIYILGNM